MHVATPRDSVLQVVQKPCALQQNGTPTGEPLMTPDQMNDLRKQQTADSRKAFQAAKKRQKAVAHALANNGVTALSAELQNQNDGAMLPVRTTPTLDTPTIAILPVGPTVPKRPRIAPVPVPMVPTIMPVLTGPPQIKCQGCVHGDLLEMKVMEPSHIKHYLKPEGFLELATCAGECKHRIKAIYLALPKANLHCCDEANKGFYAPDDDPTKADLECGHILCSPCRAMRAVQCELENSKKGDGSRRTSRRNAARQ